MVGSLNDTELIRLSIGEDMAIEQEVIVSGLSRIRDVATGSRGEVYMLLELGETGRIVRRVPTLPVVRATPERSW